MLAGAPDGEDAGEQDREAERADPQRHAEPVGEDVGVERAGDAHDDDGQPVGGWDVAVQAHLHDEHDPEPDGDLGDLVEQDAATRPEVGGAGQVGHATEYQPLLLSST